MTTARECDRIARQAIDALNAHDVDGYVSLFADKSETHTVPTDERSFGPAGARADTERWMRAFPDLHFEIESVTAAEDAAVLELLAQGTHNGPLEMPEADHLATGRSFKQRVCLVMHFADGKITLERDYFDVAGLMEQLQVEKEPALGTRVPSREQRPSA